MNSGIVRSSTEKGFSNTLVFEVDMPEAQLGEELPA